MEITITVSEKIYELAKQNGKDVAEFVEEVLEEKENEQMPRYMRMKGMFASKKTDTAKRMSEMLYEENFDSKEGFSTK